MSSLLQVLSKFSLIFVFLCAAAFAQEPAAKPPDATPPSEKAAAAKSEEKTALPFQIQLLETHIRFESNGDSRKEVHTIVKINDLAGARQFSRLGFDYNRAFQHVEIPLVKISHANGGTSEILPSAISDAPNPGVQEFPAYHDVRVKSVRILGLQDGDTIEYRVITTTTKHPLAPDFWLEHTFDRSGQVVREDYTIDLPAFVELKINKETPADSVEKTGEGQVAREIYIWHRKHSGGPPDTSEALTRVPDIALSTLNDWMKLSARMATALYPESAVTPGVTEKFRTLTASSSDPGDKLRRIYDFVARNIRTVDLRVGSTGYHTQPLKEILTNGYATEEDKAALLAGLARAGHFEPLVYLTFPDETTQIELMPSRFQHALVSVLVGSHENWMDPGVEVAPFGMIPSSIRGKTVLCATPAGADRAMVVSLLPKAPIDLPFDSAQKVEVEAAISPDGKLGAKVHYRLRGDNELLLRVAFHQTPKERWKEVAGLLALSDGFRGTIANVTASDPMATKEPFTVEYELTQPKFVDWSKQPVRIPALLPQIALPDPPGKSAEKIELGTPLDVQTNLTLNLPEGTTVQTPAATSVTRDYAAFASKYDGHLNTVSVSRHINFVKREIPVERAPDYNTFLRAVQNDQSQVIVLSLPEAGTKN